MRSCPPVHGQQAVCLRRRRSSDASMTLAPGLSLALDSLGAGLKIAWRVAAAAILYWRRAWRSAWLRQRLKGDGPVLGRVRRVVVRLEDKRLLVALDELRV